MNIQQIEYNFRFLLDEIQKKNQEEIKTGCLKIVHRYSMYFNGNRNYLQLFQENKITIFGILDQLVSDLCHTLTNQYGPPGPGPVPGIAGQRIDVIVVQELCSELSRIAYGI